MLRADVFLFCQVRNGSGYLENSLMPPGTEPQLLHRQFQEFLSLRINPAVPPRVPRAHVGIAEYSLAGKPSLLALPSFLHPLRNLRRALDSPLPGHFLVLQSRHLDVDVDAIQHGTRNPVPIALDLQGRALTRSQRIGMVPARASPRCHSTM